MTNESKNAVSTPEIKIDRAFEVGTIYKAFTCGEGYTSYKVTARTAKFITVENLTDGTVKRCKINLEEKQCFRNDGIHTVEFIRPDKKAYGITPSDIDYKAMEKTEETAAEEIVEVEAQAEAEEFKAEVRYVTGCVGAWFANLIDAKAFVEKHEMEHHEDFQYSLIEKSVGYDFETVYVNIAENFKPQGFEPRAIRNELRNKVNEKLPEGFIEVNTGAETDGSEEDTDNQDEVFSLLPEVDELNDTEVGWELYRILEKQKQKALGNYETQIGKARVTFRNHQIVEINEDGLIYKNRNGRKMHFLYGDLRSKKDFFDFILWAAAHDLQKEHQAAIKSYVETDGSEEDSEEEFIAVIPTDDSKDDDELVDPPAESPAEKSDYEISQVLSALFVKATINSRYMDVTLQDGKKIVTRFGCATIQPDWDADNGFIFTNRHETFAHYDTPAQVETVIEMIKATNEHRGDKFTFPTVEELTAPTVNDIKSAAETALEEAKATVRAKQKALRKAEAEGKSTERAEHELDLAYLGLRGLENLIADSETGYEKSRG